MNTIKLIAIYAMMTGASSCFSHNRPEISQTGVIKEQKEWGIAGDARAVQRTITLSMSDTMRFTPDTIEVKQGETIRLVLQNRGQLTHELVIGTQKELDAHAALMVQFPDMEHDEPYMAHVDSGKTSQLIWTFNRAGEFDFACLISGHDQAGMVGKITVTAPWTAGEVRKIDTAAKKITLKHEEIKNLDMPGMTMAFRVQDPALLDKVKAGDKVRFTVDRIRGAYIVLSLEPATP